MLFMEQENNYDITVSSRFIWDKNLNANFHE